MHVTFFYTHIKELFFFYCFMYIKKVLKKMFSTLRKDFTAIANKHNNFQTQDVGASAKNFFDGGKGINRTKCINKFKMLLSNRKLKQIELVGVGNRKAFRVRQRKQVTGGKIFSGLTKTMAKCFYPHSADEMPADREKRRSKRGGPPNLAKRLKSTCKTHGKEHGSVVHKQIEEFTDTLIGKLSLEHFEIRNPNPDRCFKKFIRLCSIKGWVPVASELAIYDEDLGVATSVDVLVLDSNTAEMIVIELKTSYESTCYQSHPSDAAMTGPLSFLKDCPLNRALLQVFVSGVIIEKNYRVVPDKLAVVRICPKQDILEIYTMPDWLSISKNRHLKEDIFRVITNRKNSKEKKILV